jgi:hypothetical protein
MAIQSSELTWRYAALTSDVTPAQNGGRMTTTAIPSGTASNLFPAVTQAQRTTGAVQYRKDFLHVASAEDIALQDVKIFIAEPTAAADWFTFAPGTPTDTQATMAGAAYGSAALAGALLAGATTASLTPENIASATALNIFRVGQLVRISSEGPEAETSATSYATLSAVAYTGAAIDITFAPALPVGHAFGARVVGVYQPGSVQAAVGVPSVTSAAGTCAGAGLATHNKGGLPQNWTLTFTSATAYTIAGDTLGSIGTGTTTSDTAPANPGTGSPYFTLLSTAWGGTFAAADTVTFTTTAAAVPLWWRREVPAGCPSLTNNYLDRYATGESA